MEFASVTAVRELEREQLITTNTNTMHKNNRILIAQSLDFFMICYRNGRLFKFYTC